MSAAEKLTVVSPGIYLRGEVDYAAIEADNYSTIKHIARSPRQYLHVLENGTTDTTAKFRGTAGHVATLEPERFVREFAVFEGDRKAGKEWKAFEAEHAGKTIIKQAEFETAMAIRDAVRGDPLAAKYLRKGTVEPTLVWRDPETGLLCKGRPDFITHDHVVVDLKTTRDVTPWSFARDVANFAYHVQATFYCDGYEALVPMSRPRAVIIAVDSKAPHDVIVYTLDEEIMGAGRDAYRAMLSRLRECRRDGKWPGHANGIELALRLPAWATPDESDLDAIGLE
jgi:exodeoxyribonuclease VIII